MIETEREIQAILEREKKKADEWVERVRAEAGQEIAREEERLKALSARAMAAARADAEAKAAEIIASSNLRAQRLAHLDDSVRKILVKYLPRILPGREGHDRQNVEG